MTNELEVQSLWELKQNGTLYQLIESFQTSASRIIELSSPLEKIQNDLLLTQIFIAIIGATIIGVTFLPFGATKTSIQACQLNTNKKLLKTGGALITISTSISAILFIQVLKLSQMLGQLQ